MNDNDLRALEFENLYLTDEYILKHPSLHAEHSPWKVIKISLLLERFMRYFKQNFKAKQLNLLDIGGGTGLILSAIAREIERNYNVQVNKFALDLSPHALEIQKKTNPDLKKALNEDICKTSLKTKEMDLTLMIDVLEHIPNPVQGLKEVKRISKFVIMKVPLEDNLLYNLWNLITGGKHRQNLIETWGHINMYNYGKVKHQIEKHVGKILGFYFTNVFQHSLDKARSTKNKLISLIASYAFRLSPEICSLIFSDYVMVLVECYY
jgi:SAM-dependent methyltransferase